MTFILSLVSCTTAPRVADAPTAPPVRSAKMEHLKFENKPVAKQDPTSSVLLDHKFFQVHYSPKFKLAACVRYTLRKEDLAARAGKRKEKFAADPLLKPLNLPQVTPEDYAKSGYDRGHLAPAADFPMSQDSVDATFVMSNMVPQKPGLNRQAWKELEEKVRRWACGEERVIVFTGPVLEEKLPTLASGVPIPHRFFKLIVDDTPPRRLRAFIYHQEDHGKIMRDREVPPSEIAERVRENCLEDPLSLEQRLPAQAAAWKECSVR